MDGGGRKEREEENRQHRRINTYIDAQHLSYSTDPNLTQQSHHVTVDI
jgi:hypothetical protein